jgi:hypothetical protein
MRFIAALFLACFQLCAHSQTFGDWFVEPENNAKPFLFTANDSGGIFGKWCDAKEGHCFWLLALKTSCATGASAPALLSFGGEVTSVQLTCFGELMIANERYYRYTVSNPDTVDRGVLGSSRVSFAMALEADNFRVMRFNTSGARAALSRLGSAMNDWDGKLRPTKDKIL